MIRTGLLWVTMAIVAIAVFMGGAVLSCADLPNYPLTSCNTCGKVEL